MIKSGFTKDLRTLWFQFDQNVEGPNLCDDIFTSTTMSQIGYGIELLPRTTMIGQLHKYTN